MTGNRIALARYLEEAIRRVDFSPPGYDGGLKSTLRDGG